MAELAKIGDVTFTTTDQTFDRLQRTAGWKWAEQARLGRAPALQFTADEAETITVSGTIYPGQAGAPADPIAALTALGAARTPHSLNVGIKPTYALGQWVVERIERTETHHFANGTPRRVDFTLTLKRYGPDDR